MLAAALLAAALPALAQRALVSHAEQPAKLIRKTTVFNAPAGASLQPGDIVESGVTGLQIEWSNGALMALGPSSSVQLDAIGGTPAVNLLRGWLKIASRGPAPTQLTAMAGLLEVRLGSGSGIVHLAADKTELFVELGTLSALDHNRPGAALPVNREQYAVYSAAPGLQVAPRAPRQFVSDMPRAFFDLLVAVAGRATPANAAPLREVSVQDLTNWRDVPASVNKRLVVQFSPRLSDPTFARDAVTALANDPDWKLALRQNIVVKQRAKAVTNHLF